MVYAQEKKLVRKRPRIDHIVDSSGCLNKERNGIEGIVQKQRHVNCTSLASKEKEVIG